MRGIMAENIRGEITEGPIWRRLVSFSAPILAGGMLQQLYNIADAVIVGRFVGDRALAAVGASTPLTNLILGLFLGLSAGCCVATAQFRGAGDARGLDRAVHTSAAVALAGGALLTVIGVIAAPHLLAAMGTPPDVIGGAALYMRVIFAAMIPSMAYNVGAGVLRSLGDSRRPLYYLAAALALNAVLALIFVGALGMGVLGAALATALSQTLSASLVAVNLALLPGEWRLRPKKIRPDRAVLIRIIKVGVPAGLQTAMMAFANASVQAAVNSFGSDAVAAWTVFGKIEGFIYLPISSFGVSITTFVGQNLGAELYSRAKRSVLVCLAMSLGIAAATSALLLLARRPLVMMFTDSAAVFDYAIVMLWGLVPMYALFSFIEILSGALRGANAAGQAMAITLVGLCIFRVVWVTAAMRFMPALPVIMMNYPATWVITSLSLIIYYLRGSWLERFKVAGG